MPRIISDARSESCETFLSRDKNKKQEAKKPCRAFPCNDHRQTPVSSNPRFLNHPNVKHQLSEARVQVWASPRLGSYFGRTNTLGACFSDSQRQTQERTASHRVDFRTRATNSSSGACGPPGLRGGRSARVAAVRSHPGGRTHGSGCGPRPTRRTAQRHCR